MHWNWSIDVSTTELREGGTFTHRRPSVHVLILEEGRGAVRPITSPAVRPSLFPVLQPTIRLARNDDGEGNG